MTKILLTALSWITKIPSGIITQIYDAAQVIAHKNDDPNDKTSGWDKLKDTVSNLVTYLPDKYKQFAGPAVTIIVNVALLVIRIKGAK